MNQVMLDVARRNLQPFMPRADGPEGTFFGVRLSLLGREELLAVVNFQASQHRAERVRLIAERDSLLNLHRPSLLQRALGFVPRFGLVKKP